MREGRREIEGEKKGGRGRGEGGMRITSFTPHKLQTFRDSSHLKPVLLLLRA